MLDSTLPEFQFEALWCITNVASSTSEHTQSIINKGAIEKLIALVESKYQEIQEQAIWALGNIVGDSVKVREKVVQKKGLELIIKQFSATERTSLIKTCTWSISNFCRSRPPPNYELLKPVIPQITRALYKLEEDYEFIVDATWILSYLSENYKKSIKLVLELNLLPKLAAFLDLPLIHIQLTCLRILGNIVAGSALQTQAVIEADCLQYFKRTIFHEKRSVRKETCWILSNIAAGTQQQIQALIVNDFLAILERKIKEDEPEVKTNCNL